MRPIRLLIDAFGPFADRVDVDFRRMANIPVFGIYGPTGAGKTSILDAMTFALFGKTSGDERQSDDVRSGHAASSTLTQVQLVFAVGSATYLIARAPIQEVPRRSGTGTTTKQQEVSLFDVTGIPVDQVSIDGETGTVITEKRVKEADQAVRELIGYDAGQFRQVVVLPQGQFRGVLTADSAERSRIYRKLFPIRLYERFAEELRERTREARQLLTSAATVLKTTLEDAEVSDVSEIERRVVSHRQDLDAAIKLVAAAARARELAESALTEVRKHHSAWVEHDEAEEEHRELEADKGRVEALNSAVERSIRARTVTPLADALDIARTRESETKSRLSTTRTLLAESRSEADEAKRRSDEFRSRAGEVDLWKAELTEAKKAVETLGEVDRLAAAGGEAQSALSEAKRVYEALIRDEEVASERLTKLHGGWARLSEAKDRRDELDAALRRLDERLRAATKREEAARALTAREAERAAADQAERGAQERYERATRARAELEAKFAAGAAARLAADLRPGDPCPVCGATDHPVPAADRSEDLPDGADVDAAREAERVAGGDRLEASKHAARAHELENAAREALDAIEPDDEPLEALMESKANAEARRAEADHARAEAQTLVDGIEPAQEALNDIRRRREAAGAAVEAATQQYSNVDGLLQAARRSLGSFSLDSPAARERVRELGEQIDRFERDRVEAESQREAKTAALAKSESLEGELASTLERCVTDRETAEQHLLAALEREGFADLDEQRAATMTESAEAEARATIDKWTKNLVAATSRLERARKAIADTERPDLSAAEQALAEARGGEERASASRAQKETELRAVEGLTARARERFDEHEKARAAHDLTAGLWNTVGAVHGGGVSLVDYVLGIYFDRVLDRANVRLARMTRDRYSLYRSESADGRKQTGLDIQVFDAHTNRRREARTLSGGEGFLASLSLALGLSEVVQEDSGGIRLETIFIDEGFGHLDDEALDQALQTLIDLTEGSRGVGIISHVDEVKRIVPVGFEVTRGREGSQVGVRRSTG